MCLIGGMNFNKSIISFRFSFVIDLPLGYNKGWYIFGKFCGLPLFLRLNMDLIRMPSEIITNCSIAKKF